MTATVTDMPAVGRDPRIEEWLDAQHVKWEYTDALPFADIDIKRSLANQARVDEPLIPDTVELYEAGYRNGDQFPPLLARRTSPRARLALLGGNHRTAAATRAGLTAHPAYVVECTDEAALGLMYDDNRRHGAQLPKKQRIAQAIHLVEVGWAQAAAARLLGLSDVEVSMARSLAKAGQRAATLGVSGFDDLPAGHRQELAKIPSDPVFTETAKLIVAARIQGEDAKALIKRVRECRSDNDALTLLGNEIEDRRDDIQRAWGGKAKKRVTVTPYSRVKNACMSLQDVAALADDVWSSCPTPDARERLRKQLRETAKTCMAIEKSLT